MAVMQDARAFVRVSQNSHDFQGEIEVSRNRSSFNPNEKKRILEFLRFYSFFTIFEEVYIDLTRQKIEFETEKDASYNYLGEVFNTIDMKINSVEKEIDRAKNELRDLEAKIKEDANRVVVQGYSTRQVSETVKGIAESAARMHIDSARLQDMENAKAKAKLLAEIQIYPENLKNLNDQRVFVMSDLKMKIDQNTEEFEKRWAGINNYYQAIIRSGNPLENNSELDRDTLTEFSHQLVPCLDQLKLTKMILFDLREEVKLRDKIIEINFEIANKKTQIAGQEVAMPYLEALLEQLNKKANDLKGQQAAYVAGDKVEHLTTCIKDINENIHDITTDLSNLRGHADLKTGDVVINARIRPMKYTDPSNYRLGPESQRLHNELIECIKDRDGRQHEYDLLGIYRRELEELENRKKGFHFERAAGGNALNQLFINIAESYTKLFATRVDLTGENFAKAFVYDISMLNCILFVLSKYISISRKPGCCSCGSASELLAVDITATQLIKTFVKILGIAMKVKTGCCSGNDLSKIYNCTNIDLNDLLNLLLDNRVLGSLLDENGKKQKVVNNTRTAFVKKSLFYCLRELMSIRSIQYAHLYEINKVQIVGRIKTYEGSLIKTLHHLNYLTIANKAEHHKFIKI